MLSCLFLTTHFEFKNDTGILGLSIPEKTIEGLGSCEKSEASSCIWTHSLSNIGPADGQVRPSSFLDRAGTKSPRRDGRPGWRGQKMWTGNLERMQVTAVAWSVHYATTDCRSWNLDKMLENLMKTSLWLRTLADTRTATSSDFFCADCSYLLHLWQHLKCAHKTV